MQHFSLMACFRGINICPVPQTDRQAGTQTESQTQTYPAVALTKFENVWYCWSSQEGKQEKSVEEVSLATLVHALYHSFSGWRVHYSVSERTLCTAFLAHLHWSLFLLIFHVFSV